MANDGDYWRALLNTTLKLLELFRYLVIFELKVEVMGSFVFNLFIKKFNSELTFEFWITS